jgi:hypothetical protein
MAHPAYAVDFAALFVLFRDSFSFVPRRIFSSFPPSFCKTCVFNHTDDKQMGATHKYGCTVGSFGQWGPISPQRWHRWMSERCFFIAICVTVLLGLFLLHA